MWERPKFDGVVFDKLFDEADRGLIVPFSLEEIKLVVRESDGQKPRFIRF